MNALQPVAKTILNAVPILPSLNLSETRNFYVDTLGFEDVGFDGLDYLVVRRGGMELHFWLSDDPLQCQNSSVFFRAEAPTEIYRDFCDRGIEAIRPSDNSGECGGTVRFHIRDPHGNLLMFGGAVSATMAH
ncbi:MAG: glyoxalase [Agrobacterium sp. SCN 61-19]|nr:MAG: glyoxalase [Agrobacterium sp. SCN 61-19]